MKSACLPHLISVLTAVRYPTMLVGNAHYQVPMKNNMYRSPWSGSFPRNSMFVSSLYYLRLGSLLLCKYFLPVVVLLIYNPNPIVLECGCQWPSAYHDVTNPVFHPIELVHLSMSGSQQRVPESYSHPGIHSFLKTSLQWNAIPTTITNVRSLFSKL